MAKAGRCARGMTLIEIMVVLVILGMIAGAVAWNVFKVGEDANRQAAMVNARKLVEAAEAYRFRNGSLPETLAALAPDLVREVPLDPWRVPFVLVPNGDSFLVCSNGPDKTQGGADDICAPPPPRTNS